MALSLNGIAISVAAGVTFYAVSVGYAYHAGGVDSKAKLDSYVSEQTKLNQAAAAERANLQAQLDSRTKELENETARQKAQTAADAAKSATANSSLQQRIYALSNAVQTCSHTLAVTSGQSQPSADPARVLADMSSRLSKYGLAVSGYADGLKVAGKACEAKYDSVQQSVK